MATTAPTTITETVNLDLKNVALDTNTADGLLVLNGTLSYQQSVTGNYSADGKTFTPTSYGTPSNITVTNFVTSGGTAYKNKSIDDSTVLNDTFTPSLNQANTINLTPGTNAFDNVGIRISGQSNSGFKLEVFNGSDDSATSGTGSTYDVLTLNIKENQVALGSPIAVDSNGRIDFINSVSLNSGSGASIQQYDYKSSPGSGSFSLHSLAGYTAPAASDAATPGVTDTVVCYVKGTTFKTQHGDIKVEDLRVGDMLLTVEGQYKPVIWIGFNTIDCKQQINKDHAYPVRISQNAFGLNMPSRDLFVSPLHSIYVSGVMIPAIHLINGVTITQDSTVSLVTYYHVELPTHDVVYAEGLPAETYLDTTPQNRQFFAQGKDGDSKVFTINTQLPSYPQDTPLWQYIWDTQGYAPLIQDGPILDSVRATLNEHAVLMQENNRLVA